jgi:hypothetical protein
LYKFRDFFCQGKCQKKPSYKPDNPEYQGETGEDDNDIEWSRIDAKHDIHEKNIDNHGSNAHDKGIYKPFDEPEIRQPGE